MNKNYLLLPLFIASLVMVYFLLEIAKIEQIETTYNRYIFIFFLVLSLLFFIVYELVPKIKSSNNQHFKEHSRKNQITLILVFMIFAFAISKFIFYRYNTDIKHYKQLVLGNVINKYDLIYQKNKQQAVLIHDKLLYNQDVVSLIEQGKRNQLLQLLEQDYQLLVNNFNVRQLHFHLKNSDSFLRLHKPSKFGDNLAKIRPSIHFVNTHLQAFDGFEEGRIYNGFRNVFPLFNLNKEHIGSVEISFGADKFIDDLLGGVSRKASFLIKKEIVAEKVFLSEKDNYSKSPLQGFYYDKKVLQSLQYKNLNYSFSSNSVDEFKDIANMINKGQPFIRFYESTNELISFIPIKNKITGEVVASIIIASKNLYIKEQLFNARVNSFVSLILLSIVFLFTYREILSRHRAEKLARHSKQILDSQESLIMITDGKKMVEANRALLEYLGYQSLNDFFKQHQCICDLFEAEAGKNYLQAEMNGISWLLYILTHTDSPKVKITGSQGQTKIFKIEHSDYAQGRRGHIVSFFDITDIENIHQILKQRIASAIEENRDKDQLLQQQSKLASMGEMIGAIAHQWRQPLNELNINIQNLDDDYEDDLIDKKFIDDFIKRNRKVILFMSKTIDDFRNFFRIDKINEKFSIKDAIKSTLSIQSAQLKNHCIEVSIDGDDFDIDGFKSEFQQVILNIINNAKDALLDKQVDKELDKQVEAAKINIKLQSEQRKITITDNAGGIPEDILDRVFEPYFTTKQQGDGTGMGLYMSKMIIEKNMNGKLSIKNTSFNKTSQGAQFSIRFFNEK